MLDRRLALTIYRSLLRFGRSSADVPYSLRSTDITALDAGVLGVLGMLGTDGLCPTDPVSQLARLVFRRNRDLEGAAAADALDSGLLALRILNNEYGSRIDHMRQQRAEKADRSGLPEGLRVGQVVLHRRYGYRGVVYGWDRSCERDSEWCAAMGVEPNQPFFYVLPDENDCMRLFGALRMSKYVAAANLEPVEQGRIVHRSVTSFFSGYKVRLGRYVPTPQLQWQYPGDCLDMHAANGGDDDTVTIEADANLLLHSEPETPAKRAVAAAGADAEMVEQ